MWFPWLEFCIRQKFNSSQIIHPSGLPIRTLSRKHLLFIDLYENCVHVMAGCRGAGVPISVHQRHHHTLALVCSALTHTPVWRWSTPWDAGTRGCLWAGRVCSGGWSSAPTGTARTAERKSRRYGEYAKRSTEFCQAKDLYNTVHLGQEDPNRTVDRVPSAKFTQIYIRAHQVLKHRTLT